MPLGIGMNANYRVPFILPALNFLDIYFPDIFDGSESHQPTED